MKTLSPSYLVLLAACALLASGLVGCEDDSGFKPATKGIRLSPDTTAIKPGGQVTFSATVTGLEDESIRWYVNDERGGNLAIGTITSEGVYKAPRIVPIDPVVKVKAECLADTAYFATASVRIVSSIVVEMESFVDTLKTDTGMPISRVYCSQASGRSAVENLEQVGDAIVCVFSVDQPGHYSGVFRAQASTGARALYEITIDQAGLLSEEDTAVFEIMGKGVG